MPQGSHGSTVPPEMIRGRRRHEGDGDAPATEPEYIEIDPRDLTNVFAVPQWFRDVGLTSWLFVAEEEAS